jgi:hypothetical protein
LAIPADANTQAILADLQISADKLNTAQEIAEFLGEDLGRVRYLIRASLIPIGREGRRIIASRRALREHYAKATGVAA